VPKIVPTPPNKLVPADDHSAITFRLVLDCPLIVVDWKKLRFRMPANPATSRRVRRFDQVQVTDATGGRLGVRTDAKV